MMIGAHARSSPKVQAENGRLQMKRGKVRIITGDVRRLRRFYERVTGLTPTGDDRYTEFHAPEMTLGLAYHQRIDTMAPGATEPASNRSTVFDFEVDDVDHEYKRLRQFIDEFVMEPTTQPWGTRSLLFRDPDGNLINFFTRARTTVDATNDRSPGH
jgi:predicted enzyme related to lactoylglutathione lyase